MATPQGSPDTIADRLASVRERIARACERAGRAPADVTLIGVTKTHPAETIAAAVRAGLSDVGENRVQEARGKADVVRALDIAPRWHLIGHLQTNKVAAALDLFDILHTVDSERLAEAVNAAAQRAIDVLIEVNVAGETTKFGVAPSDVARLAERVRDLPNIRLRGLMTVAPLSGNAEDVRPVFRTLREIRDAIGLPDLSIGMTGDFEVAVEEGSTLVRVGRALFGPRPG